MTTLQGSEKQIKWAVEIRQSYKNYIDEVKEGNNTFKGFVEELARKQYLIEKGIERYEVEFQQTKYYKLNQEFKKALRTKVINKDELIRLAETYLNEEEKAEKWINIRPR